VTLRTSRSIARLKVFVEGANRPPVRASGFCEHTDEYAGLSLVRLRHFPTAGCSALCRTPLPGPREETADTTGMYYLRRFRPQTSLISRATIIKMVATTMGPANIANIVSILQLRERQRLRRLYCARLGIICPLWTS
jgi:hypothetical protein